MSKTTSKSSIDNNWVLLDDEGDVSEFVPIALVITDSALHVLKEDHTLCQFS